MTWDPDLLARIDSVDEVQISSRRADGTLRRFVIIWAVAVDGELFARSAYGPDSSWYRHALASGTGAIKAGDVDSDVTVSPGTDADQAAIDAAYHRKYDRYGERIVGTVVGSAAHQLTVRIAPQAA